MCQAGKLHQVAKEMKRFRLAVLGVSETRWIGAGRVHLTTGETVLYSRLAGDDAPHEKGVALILSKEAGKSLKEWEPISEQHEEDHHPTSDFYQLQTLVHLESVVSEKDFA